jgi:hypothetical protein
MVLDGPDGAAGVGGDGQRPAGLALGDEGGDRNGAPKGARRRGRSACPLSLGRPVRADRNAVGAEGHDDRAVPVRPKDAGAGRSQAFQGDPAWVAVRIAGAGRRDRDPWPHRVHEPLRRGRAASVVRHLEEIDMGESPGEQLGIDRLLDVAHQQEPAPPDRAIQHDRDVVDARAGVGRLSRDLAGPRPEDSQGDLVDRQSIAGCNGRVYGRRRRRQLA